jgi:hypothetical protein
MLSGAARRGSEPPSSDFMATCSPSTLATSRPPEPNAPRVDPRELPVVKEALVSIDKGGYAEALARVAFLMAHRDAFPLTRLQLA